MVTKKFLLMLPSMFLVAAISAQLGMLNYCFGSGVSAISYGVLFGAAAIFGTCFALGTIFPSDNEKNSLPIPAKTLYVIAIFLVIASALYVIAATIRVYVRWDSFAVGPAAARFALMNSRTGVTAVGFFNFVFLGAPSVLTLFVCVFAERIPRFNIFRLASVILFGVFVYLVALEGGRSPYLFSLVVICAAVLFHLYQGHTLKSAGPSYLIGLVAISIFGFTTSYREIAAREAVTGRTSAAQAERNYSAYIDGAASTAGHTRDTVRSTSSLVMCFYGSHSTKSIDKIVKKGADKNLYGFYLMPNYYKIAETLKIATKPWLSFSDYYGTTGMFVGLTGALLIDFSWIGLLILAPFGLFLGVLSRLGLTDSEKRSSLSLVAPIAPVLFLASPLSDVISSAQFQSMLPFLVLITATLFFSRRTSNYLLRSKTA